MLSFLSRLISLHLISLRMKFSARIPLRELADSHKVEYHGTIWLLGELIEKDLLSQKDAARALRTMLDNKRWLPRADSERLIKKWESLE